LIAIFLVASICESHNRATDAQMPKSSQEAKESIEDASGRARSLTVDADGSGWFLPSFTFLLHLSVPFIRTPFAVYSNPAQVREAAVAGRLKNRVDPF
jgi:sugar lactone lactonase YvrE